LRLDEVAKHYLSAMQSTALPLSYMTKVEAPGFIQDEAIIRDQQQPY